mmetsp:Transcript_69929/g.193383  ORF Transcript_69929/g.193383 Transcript_69929/m.193383 type:complete len:215 (+) Transcript_69929:1931-2575(+)
MPCLSQHHSCFQPVQCAMEPPAPRRQSKSSVVELTGAVDVMFAPGPAGADGGSGVAFAPGPAGAVGGAGSVEELAVGACAGTAPAAARVVVVARRHLACPWQQKAFLVGDQSASQSATPSVQSKTCALALGSAVATAAAVVVNEEAQPRPRCLQHQDWRLVDHLLVQCRRSVMQSKGSEVVVGPSQPWPSNSQHQAFFAPDQLVRQLDKPALQS